MRVRLTIWDTLLRSWVSGLFWNGELGFKRLNNYFFVVENLK